MWDDAFSEATPRLDRMCMSMTGFGITSISGLKGFEGDFLSSRKKFLDVAWCVSLTFSFP